MVKHNLRRNNIKQAQSKPLITKYVKKNCPLKIKLKCRYMTRHSKEVKRISVSQFEFKVFEFQLKYSINLTKWKTKQFIVAVVGWSRHILAR